MYSRKYIRSLPTSAPIAQSSGGASPEQGHPLPPPDYAGVAFRGSAERNAQDFPETLIPLADTADVVGEPNMSAPTDAPPESAVPRSDGDEVLFEPQSDEPIEAGAGEDLYEGENAPPSPDQGGMPSPLPEPPPEGSEQPSDSPLRWLRELKMEDLLLLWLLLMLLYGESSDEIELLLGLLLFASR